MTRITYWIFFAALCSVPPLLNFYSGQLNGDLAQTLYHARELAAGRTPYLEITNHHFLGYVIPFWLVELAGGLSPLTVALLQALYHLSCAACLACIVMLLTKDTLLGMGAGFFYSTAGWLPEFSGDNFQYQSCTLPLLFSLIYLIIRGHQSNSRRADWLAALNTAALLACDQRLALFSLLLGTTSVRVGIRAAVARIALPFCAALAAPLLVIWAAGAWPDFIEQTVMFPFVYRSAGFAGSGLFEGLALIKFAFTESGVAWLGTAGLALILITEKDGYVRWTMLILVYCSLVYAVAGGRVFPNYLLIFAVPLLIGAASAPYYSLRAFGSVTAYRFCFFLLLCAAVWKESRLLGTERRFQTLHQVGARVEQLIPQSDDLLVWGYCPQLYIYSSRFTSFREMSLLSFAGSVFHLSPPGNAGVWEKYLTEFKRYLAESPPRLIVAAVHAKSAAGTVWAGGCNFGDPAAEAASGLSFMREYIAKNYRARETSSFGDASVTIYLRDPAN